MAYSIVLPVAGQPNSASLFGRAVRDAINDLDARMSALEGFTTGKPIGMIVQVATQSLSNNVGAALQFAAADIIDTHAQHDIVTNNTRITPNVAGYYRFFGVLYHAGRTDFTARSCWFQKNGSVNSPFGDRQDNLVNSVNVALATETMQSMNGTTDYVEFMALQANTGAASVLTQNSTQFASGVMWEYVRGL